MKTYNSSPILNLFLFIFIFLFVSGCTPNVPHRNETSVNCDLKSNLCKNSVWENYKNHEIGILEFSDQGNAYNPDLHKYVLDKLRKYSEVKEKIIQVIFAHGWKHNSATKDTNLQDFRYFLSFIANNHVFGNKKVVGVYIGWRGLSLHGAYTENLTYWTRKSVAQEIGRGSLSSIVSEIDRYNLENPNSSTVFIGHSFGAAMLLSSLNDILINRVHNAQTYNTPTSIGDSIILLNPAIEANQALPLKLISQRIALDTPNHSGILHILSSNKDKATQLPFYVGQYLDGIFGDYRTLTYRFKDTSDELKDVILKERDLYTKTVGNYPPFITGNILSGDKGSLGTNTTGDFAPNHGEKFGDFQYFSCCADLNSCLLSHPINDKNHIPCTRYEPVTFTYTDGGFIGDHNDIFNPNVFTYITVSVVESAFNAIARNYKNTSGIKEISAECYFLPDEDGPNINYEFDFSGCYNYYSEKFSNYE